MPDYHPNEKQESFHADGGFARHRLITHAQRAGGTYACVNELAMHMSGQYPEDWVGRRFSLPVSVLACGLDTSFMKTIMLPKLQGALTPGINLKSRRAPFILKTKTFRQTLDDIEDWKFDIVWIDCEPPLERHRALLKMTRGAGMSMMCFVPLNGFTAVIAPYLQGDVFEHGVFSNTVIAAWDTEHLGGDYEPPTSIHWTGRPAL